MMSPKRIKQVVVTFDDNTTKTIRGSGSVAIYDTQIKGEPGESPTDVRILEIAIKVESESGNHERRSPLD